MADRLSVWPKFQRMADEQLEAEVRGWTACDLPSAFNPLTRGETEQYLMAMLEAAELNQPAPSYKDFITPVAAPTRKRSPR